VRGHSHILVATYCLCFCSLVSNQGTEVTDGDPPHIQILPSEVFWHVPNRRTNVPVISKMVLCRS
jgi:hypothetical protein